MVEQIETRAQVEVLTGVRFSEPWMDAEFCRAIARVPPWRLAARHQERGLFRHALRSHVPDSVRLRPDKAAISPALERMTRAAGGEALLANLLEARRLAKRGLVNPHELSRVLRAFFARGPADHRGGTWTTLWAIAAAEAFLAREDRA